MDFYIIEYVVVFYKMSLEFLLMADEHVGVGIRVTASNSGENVYAFPVKMC